jgi:signal transduction histidine kinase
MRGKNRSEPHVNKFRGIRSRLVWQILSIPIFLKIMGIGFLVAIIFGSVTLIQTRTGTSRILSQHLKEKVLDAAKMVAKTIQTPAGIGDTDSIQRQLNEIREIYADLVYIIVLYPDGRVMASTFQKDAPADLLNTHALPHTPEFENRIFNNHDGKIYEASAPILSGKAGTVLVGFTDDMVFRGLKTYTGIVLWGLLLCVALGACLALLLTNILTRPIRYLMESVNQIRVGKFETRADVFSNDEIGHLAVAFNQMAEALRRYQQEVKVKEKSRISLIERIVQIQENERKSISRELHDQLGQLLLAILLQVQSIRSRDSQNDSACQSVEDSIRQAINEVHRLAWGMRPSILDDYGLDSALARHIEEVSSHSNLEIDYSFTRPPGLERLPSRIEVPLFRIAQEAITNIQRHAGATHASVVVLWQPHAITLLVEDNGHGFNPSILQEKGDICLGLVGMRERVSLLGGTVDIESIPGKGATIRAKIPLNGETHA